MDTLKLPETAGGLVPKQSFLSMQIRHREAEEDRGSLIT